MDADRVKVLNAVSAAKKDVSANYVAEQLGITRRDAQDNLSYLFGAGDLEEIQRGKTAFYRMK